MDAARQTALGLLIRVLAHKRPLDATLIEQTDLEPRERAFARRLASLTLRRLGQIDYVIARCLRRPLPAQAVRARHALRLGACQILFTEVPDHAAVATSVDLLSLGKERRYAKLANAVLRRVTREGATWLADQDAARLNMPDWLWESWGEAYGPDLRRRIAEAHLHNPPLDLSVVGSPDQWARRLGARLSPSGGLRLDLTGAVSELPGFSEGAWWVQDAAAALPVALLGEVTGKRVLDLCAAPGGKTAQLAVAGARVTALDQSTERMARLKDNLARLNLKAETVVADAGQWRPQTLFDAVLLDAPCSATGTLRRHPDVAYLKTAEDVTSLARLQATMLKNAARLVAPGGVLVYCSCSLQPQEGEAHAKAAIGLSPWPIGQEELPGLAEAISKDGHLRTRPDVRIDDGGLDGFFATRWRAAP